MNGILCRVHPELYDLITAKIEEYKERGVVLTCKEASLKVLKDLKRKDSVVDIDLLG